MMRQGWPGMLALVLLLLLAIAPVAEAQPICGNGNCANNTLENCSNCPQDCPCPPGSTCQDDLCPDPPCVAKCKPNVCGPGQPPCPDGSLCFKLTPCPQPPCAGFCLPYCSTPCPPGTVCDPGTQACVPGGGGGGGGTPVRDIGFEIYHLDALGSVRMLTDESGEVLARYDYLPFGEEIEPHINGRAAIPGYGADRGPRRFTGKERDAESGLDYFGARYYSGPAGRFTGVDPLMTLGPNAADPQRWNRYTYTRNNPLRFVDPDGRDWLYRWIFGEEYVKRHGDRSSFTVFFEGDVREDIARAGPPFVQQVATDVAIGTAAAAGPAVATNVRLFLANPAAATRAAWAGLMSYFASPQGQNTVAGIAEDIAGAAPGSMSSGLVLGRGTAGGAATSREAQKGIRSLEKRITEHEAKLAESMAKPTVRPGMEGQPTEVIEAAQQSRIRHLEKEIQTFRENIEKLKRGGE